MPQYRETDWSGPTVEETSWLGEVGELRLERIDEFGFLLTTNRVDSIGVRRVESITISPGQADWLRSKLERHFRA